jgi:uncharacterized protein
VLLDTSGLLCLHHRDEPFHDEASSFFESAWFKVTHSYVLAEFVALAETRGLPREPALQFVAAAMDNPVIELTWVDEDQHRTALSFLQERLDKSYSLCDAVSFLLMRERGITEALTTDRHFEQEGFVRLLKP